MTRAVRGPLLIIALIALLLVGLWLWVRTSLPQLDGRIELAGLAATVVIERDEHGVPLITADSQEDLYYALGFVHAQDRLWQMEHRRLRAAGRLAQLLGEEALGSDMLMRTIGLQGAAERTVASLSPRAAGALQAYSDGVNAYLERHGGILPLEFQLLGHTPASWTAVDVALLQKLTSWQRTNSVADELFRGRLAGALDSRQLSSLLGGPGPRLSDDYRALPLAELQGLLGHEDGVPASHGWAVAGAHAVDGAPLLAFESHGAATAPSSWYLVRLRAPGIEIAGATLPGMPLVFSGRNDRIAWALVPTQADAQDLVLIQAGSDGSYLTAEGLRELDSRRELIDVRGGDDVELTVRETVFGPVISDLTGGEGEVGSGDARTLLALRWSALMPDDRTLQGGLGMVFADGWDELRASASNLDELHGTLLYADVEGRIGWQQIGRRPERRSGEGSFPSSSRSATAVWRGWIPFASLDGELDPSDGVIVAGGVDAQATADLLASLEAHTAQTSARFLEVEHLAGSDTLLEEFRSTIPKTAVGREAHAQLLGWQGGSDPDSVAPLIYQAWRRALAAELLGDELGSPLAVDAARYPHLLQRALAEERWCDDSRSEAAESCTEVVSTAFEEAVAELAQRHGANVEDWPVQGREVLVRRHPVFEESLLAPLFRVGSSGGGTSGDGADSVSGPDYRAVYELASVEADDWGSSGYLIPTGQSGNPLSPHYRDLLGRWREVALLPLLAGEAGEDAELMLEPRR